MNQYFKNAISIPASHFYNPDGRAIPDISALGVGYQIIVNDVQFTFEGSAAATATVGGIVSLLNEIRITHNKPVLGFLNPWLYGQAAPRENAFFDVVEGNNRHGCCGYTGFYATPGWDPVTGLGTPNFEVLSGIV